MAEDKGRAAELLSNSQESAKIEPEIGIPQDSTNKSPSGVVTVGIPPTEGGSDMPNTSPIPQLEDVVMEKKESKREEEKMNVEKNLRRDSIRTYHTDIARTIKNKKYSIAQIALAQSRKSDKKNPYVIKEKARNFRYYVAALVLLIIGIGASIFIVQSLGEGEEEIALMRDEIIFANNRVDIDTTQYNRRDFLNKIDEIISSSSGQIGSISEIVIKVGENPIDASNFLELLNSRISGEFDRALEGEMFAGIHIFDTNEPFLIIKIRQFDRAFAGILDWEENIIEDLSYIEYDRDIIQLGTSTPLSTSTISALTADTEFRDIVIKNRDARAIHDKFGNIRLVYSFPNKNTLVIANNEDTLAEIFDRLTTVRFK